MNGSNPESDTSLSPDRVKLGPSEVHDTEKALKKLLSNDLSSPSKEEALKIIEEQAGVSVNIIDNGDLEFIIERKSNEATQFLDLLTKKYLIGSSERGKIHIHLKPPKGIQEEELNTLILSYNGYFDRLSIKNDIDDDQLYKLLDNSPKIVSLFIKSSKLRSIPNHPNLQALETLNCSECYHLKEIKNLQALETLDCSHCCDLEEIKDLQALKKLNCSVCVSLKEIKNLQALETLDCSHCFHLEEIKDLQALKTLVCIDCRSLKEIKDLQALETLDCSDCRSLKEIKDLQALETLDCSHCFHLEEIKDLQALKTLVCSDCRSLKEIKDLQALETLNCSDCRFLEEIKDLQALKTLDCSECFRLKEIKNLQALETLDCSGCRYLKEIKDLQALKTLDCSDCKYLKNTSIFNTLLAIYFVDEKRCLELCSRMDVSMSKFKENIINYFNSKDPITFESRTSGNKEVTITKGNLRKQAFCKYPFLFDLIAKNHFSRRHKEEKTTLPDCLQSKIDSGAVDEGLQDYFQVPPKDLQKIPFSITSLISVQVIIQMLKEGTLQSKWFPSISDKTEVQSFSEISQNEVNQKLRNEQEVFVEYIYRCIKLSKDLGFDFDDNHPSSYPQFLKELIQVSCDKKGWQKPLPEGLRENNRDQRNNIPRAIDDFLTSVFLPSYIQSHLDEYEPANAKKLLDDNRQEMITSFLKGVPLSVVCKLSDKWHHPGTTAQLNKAKIFSSEKWEPLLPEPFIYEDPQLGSFRAVSLTTTSELKKEGEVLSHCVGGYTDKCLRENSHIISLRDEKDNPLSTLELQLVSGRGSKDDTENVINIKDENRYHLRKVQHYGKKNNPLSEANKPCKEIETKLFEEIREKKIKVDLPLLENERQKRVNLLSEKSDITLIGYDPQNNTDVQNAVNTYREYGIKKISGSPKSLLWNFNRLTGKEEPSRQSSIQKGNVGKKKKDEENKNNQFVKNIQESFDHSIIGEKEQVIISDKRSEKNKKGHGHVVVSLAERSKLGIDDLINILKEKIRLKDKQLLSNGVDSVTLLLSPQNVMRVLKSPSQ